MIKSRQLFWKRSILTGFFVLACTAEAVIIYPRVKFQFKNASIRNNEISPDSTNKLWYKNVVIYNLDVEVFKDSNGDGVGDFNGLTQKLGYLDSMGINVIWLSPFQPTPNKDDGYDVADFYGIDKRFGTWKNFDSFMTECGKHHFKVIMDLVLNHTSNEHPWFRSAEHVDSPLHQWYVWAKNKPSNYNEGMVFPGVQESIWSYDTVAKEYYYHRFYNFQPDLNTQNAEVQTEIRKIIAFWLGKGMAGFRIDGVPFLIEVPATEGKKFDRQFEMLGALRQYIDSIKPNAIFLGETNVLPGDNKNYFGSDGGRMNMMFNFFVNQHIFYALATRDVAPLKDAILQTGNMASNTAWVLFLRNHDEVDLGRLSKLDRNKVYRQFGPEPNMQLYERGIRRRLAPMLGSAAKVRFAYSLLFALPCVPVIRYGDEIGMGDDLSLKERLSVRTPMQWTNEQQAGFTTGTSPVRPVIDTGVFGYQNINVKSETPDTNSLLNWTIRMVRLRQSLPELAYGSCEILKSKPGIIVLQYQWRGKKIMIIHNFGNPEKVTLERSRLIKIASSDNVELTGKENKYTCKLPAWGYVWLKCQ